MGILDLLYAYASGIRSKISNTRYIQISFGLEIFLWLQHEYKYRV